MAPSKTVVLVTGANAGIGFELVAQLAAKGSYFTYLGSRNVDKGNAAVKELESRNLPGPIKMLQIDMTDDSSIEQAARTVEAEHGALDVLVNNAAVGGMGVEPRRKAMRECFDTNVTGPMITVDNFAPLLKKSKSPLKRIINVSSGAGSIGSRLKNFDPKSPGMGHGGEQYRCSKAALNMLTACQHLLYKEDGIKVLCYCPGFTVSNLSNMNKAENGAKPTSEGTRPLVDIIEGKRDNEGELFLKIDGSYPW